MKIVNIVLSALILVLALVCTVFSFFLFEKRTEMVKGWETMATSISTASTNLGSPVAPDALDFKTYDDSRMTSTANGLVSQSKKVFDQRNALAADLQGIAKSARMKEIPAADQLIAESGNVGKKDAENKGAKAIAKQVETTAKRLDAEKATTKMQKADLAKIAKIVGTGSRRNADIIRAVETCKRDREKFKAEVSRVNDRLSAEREGREKAERERDNFRRRMTAAQQEKRKVESALAKLAADYKKLTSEDYGQTAVLSDGSAEVRALVKGAVVKVDPQQGFVVTDLSTSTRVEQKIGKLTKKFDPQLRKGMELVIVRENGQTGGLQFVARIKIHSINNACSVANIPADAGKAIQVGDIVIDNSLYDAKNK